MKDASNLPINVEISQRLLSAQQHFQAKNWKSVEEICEQILRQSPQQAEALELLGLLYCQTQQFDRAIVQYQSFLALCPDNALAHYNIGTAFSKLDRLDAAIEHYQQAIALEPNFYQSHYNLGNAYQAQGQYKSAIACYEKVLTLKSDHRQALHNLGACLQSLGQLEGAIVVYQRALALKPNHALTHNSLGDALRLLGKLDAAIVHLRQAIVLEPNFPEAHQNLGTALYQQGQLSLAAESYQRSLQLRPHYPKARFNYSFVLLSLGNLSLGFQEYEWRWLSGELNLPAFSQPLWNGSDLTGKTILLYPEQGLGDTIQFIRYAEIVAQRGARVIFGCPPPLLRLLQTTPGIDEILREGDPLPAFDCYVPLLSLPHLLKTTLDTIPAAPYLTPPTREAEPFCFKTSGLKVGLVWAGNPKNAHDRDRSAKLHDFLPLLKLTGVEFYSLQKGRAAELQQFHAQFSNQITAPLHDLEPQLEDFADTAAAIAELDFVITVDTAVAHLAGAMGKPVWILLCTVPDWRWLLDREDSPWYPTARLFRQTKSRDWFGVVTRIVNELEQVIKKNASSISAIVSSELQPSIAQVVRYQRLRLRLLRSL